MKTSPLNPVLSFLPARMSSKLDWKEVRQVLSLILLSVITKSYSFTFELLLIFLKGRARDVYSQILVDFYSDFRPVNSTMSH